MSGSKEELFPPVSSRRDILKRLNSVGSRSAAYPELNGIRHRKLSFPASLNAALIHHGDLQKMGDHDQEETKDELLVPPRRRFSTVTDVTRKLSIGWRAGQYPSPEVLAQQGRILCGRYICSRLRRVGLFQRRLGLQRLRSLSKMSATSEVSEVFQYLQMAGQELERLHPKVYNSVGRQVLAGCGADKVSTRTALVAIGRELLRSEVTWAKVVSLFAVVGGLAVDSVQQGHPETIPDLVETLGLVVERSLVTWLSQRGGWMGLVHHYKPPTKESTPDHLYALLAAFVFLTLLLVFLLRLFT